MKMLNILLAIACLCPGAGVAGAQGVANADSAAWRSFAYLKASDPRLTSLNAAGLGALAADRLSVGEFTYARHNGKFVNYHESPDSYVWGAHVESFYRLDARTVVYGDVSYTHFEGKEMGGSAFLFPALMPFDLVESTDDTRGRKQRELYHLAGAIGTGLTSRLSLGAKFDYTAANYAKRRDYRHRNSLMDMYLTLGARYKLTPAVEVGGGYYYRRRTEEMSFALSGASDKEYFTIVDYGAFFGKRESSDGGSYSEKNKNTPFFDEWHGAVANAYWHPASRVSVFGELVYKRREGYYGKRSQYTPVFSEHDGSQWQCDARLSLHTARSVHHVDVKLSTEDLTNHENLYRQVTDNQGGVTRIVYYDRLKVGTRKLTRAGLAYTLHRDVAGYLPLWTLTAGADFTARKQTAVAYPRYRKQDLRYTRFYVGGERNLRRKREMYTVALNLSFASGGGTVKTDGTYDPSAEGQYSLTSQDTYLYREFDYLTARQAGAELSLQYSRLLDTGGRLRAYTRVTGGVNRAFGATHLEENDRYALQWALGCSF